MTATNKRIISLILSVCMVASLIGAFAVSGFAAQGITEAEGWFESAYAEWTPVDGADGYNAYVSALDSNDWTKLDSQLIRKISGYYRVDAVGLKAGSYQLKVVPTVSGAEQGDKAMVTGSLSVAAYDRSGYAHYNYSDGVGAYNDDGTLKKNAIVIYVTEENKNTVSVTSKDGTTVVGIGNILNSVGADAGGGKTASGGKANANAGIIRKLAEDGTPLAVRIVGNVSGIGMNGLTAFDSVDYGGTNGDNGYMARMSGGKDITIEGIGFDATINGWGLHFICHTADYSKGIGRSFEVRNIAFKNVPEDCVGMEGQQSSGTLTAPVERGWIHHCSFYAPVISNPAESDKAGGDGACDFKRGQYFTNSYCHYYGYHKTNLIGSGDDSLQYHMTYHHNYWQNCEARGPLARQANVHMYNNIFEEQTSYCMSLRANSYIFSEYNMFLKCKNVVDDRDGGVCKSYNNSFASCSFGSGKIVEVEDRSTTVSSGNKYANFDTNPSLSYIPSGNYQLQESISEMKATVLAYAGNQKENIVDPSEVETSVVPSNRYPTSAVILDYSKSLNNSTVTSTVGTFDNIVYNVKKVASDGITVGGSANDCDIVFFVNTAVNISITAVSGEYLPVLCSEDGEAIIVGTGSASNLPSGIYFIQSSGYDVGSSKYKEAKITGLAITAVDPNASVNPLPTPPTTDPDQGGNEGGNDDGDNGGNNGGDNGGNNSGDQGSTTIPVGSYVHNVTDNGTTDPSGFFTIGGSTSDSKGSVNFAGLSLTKCLKVNSGAYIRFTAPADGKVTLVFNPSCAGYTLKINGNGGIAIPSDGIVSFDVSANTAYEVLKDKSESFLYYIVYTPNELPHVHSYTGEKVDPTCTEEGYITHMCECGDSYSTSTPALGHKYRDGVCLNCGADDPDYIPEHQHSFVDGKCECGEDDPSYVPDEPEHQHAFIEGKCECGADDPDYIPNNGETPDNGDTPDDGEQPDNSTPDTPDDPQPEEPVKLNFFQRIWQAILNFFKSLFGKKN